MIYTIRTANGHIHPEFSSLAHAKAYMRRWVLALPFGPARACYVTAWIDDGDAEPAYVCCYSSLSEMRRDHDGAYAPKIERRAVYGVK